MPIMLNGTKYVGAFMNGHRVNGYINGKKMFNYIHNDPNDMFTWDGTVYKATGNLYLDLNSIYTKETWIHVYNNPVNNPQYSGLAKSVQGNSSIPYLDYVYKAADGSTWYHLLHYNTAYGVTNDSTPMSDGSYNGWVSSNDPCGDVLNADHISMDSKPYA